MPGDYQILASIHKQIGIGGFARQMTGHLIDYAQRNNWMGRQIVDLGCGTGESLLWLTKHHYIVTGVDKSTEMLTIARNYLAENNANVSLTQGDLRNVSNISGQDMVLAINVLSELDNIRELERAFMHIHSMLRDERWLVFDMYTIEGLVTRNQAGYNLEHDDDALTIFAANRFDYEKSIQYRDYIIFQKDNNGWQRVEAGRSLRAYPIQALTALVQRSGFNVQHVLNTDLNPHKPGNSTPRVIIFASKK